MTKSATAAIVDEVGGAFSLRPVSLDDLRDDELLVRIQACGICHTDLKFQARLPLPAVFGHEGTGVVEEIGADVDAVHPGDRVILSFPWCGQCPSCALSEPYRCENIPALKFGGSRLDGSKPLSLDGKPLTSAFFQQSSFATRAIVNKATVIPVQSEQAPEMLAALPCGVQTGAGAIMNTFQVGEDEPLVVIGAGAVGLSAIMAGKLAGASPIISVDLTQSRLDMALELGATHAFNAANDDIPAKVWEVMPHGARYVLESSASVPGLNDAIASIGQGGMVGIVSAPPPGETFPFSTRGLFERVGSLHAIVQGSSVPQEFLPKLIALHEQGKFPYEKIVTPYDFSNINQAIADIESGAVIKAVLVMPDE